MITLTSLKLKISVVKVVTTEGLFLTLGNIIPPFRDSGLEVVDEFDTEFAVLTVMLDELCVVVDVVVVRAVVDVLAEGYVVVGKASVKSSTTEYLLIIHQNINSNIIGIFLKNCITLKSFNLLFRKAFFCLKTTLSIKAI